MECTEAVEPLRRTQSVGPATCDNLPCLRKSSPPPAPALMLVNGAGEATTLPSPVVGHQHRRDEDDEDGDGLTSDSDIMSPIVMDHAPSSPRSHSKSLSVPTLFDASVRVNNGSLRRDYSPIRSSILPPPPPSPRRTGSPQKTPNGSNDGKNKTRPVWNTLLLNGIDI